VNGGGMVKKYLAVVVLSLIAVQFYKKMNAMTKLLENKIKK
jgi:hypothetical protein